MPSTEATAAPTIKTTESALPPTTTAPISWTPTNVAPKEYTQEPTPSETATSDRPDRSMRPKRKRPQANEEELLPKKVSGDRKAKKPRWSQIIPLKVSPHHLARLADGERIAESLPTSPEEEEETPPPQDDTIMSNADEEHGAANGASLPSVPPTPIEDFATDNENIIVKRDPRSNSPFIKPATVRPSESDALDTREIRSPVEQPPIEQPPAELPLSNGPNRPQNARPGSDSAPPSRPATSHRENETNTNKPPLPALTAPPRKEPSAMPELKWRSGLSSLPNRSPLTPANDLHTHPVAPANTSPSLFQDGFGGKAAHEREPNAVAGAARPAPQPLAASNPTSPRVDWHPMQPLPGQQRRDGQPVPPTPPATTQQPHAVHRRQASLADEVLGPLRDCPTAREMLRKTPNLSRQQLEDMKRILAQSAEAQANFDVFVAHVYGRREDKPNGGSIAAALASAVQPPPAPPVVAPVNGAAPKFSPQHIVPSNGPSNGIGPSSRLGAPAPAPARKNNRADDVERILGPELATCATVKQVLQTKPELRRKELRIMRDILTEHPQSRTDLDMLYTRLKARSEAADRESERSPSQDRKERPPTAEPRNIALPSPRATPGHGNPFNAFDSNQYGHPQQQPPPATQPAEPRYSIIRSPPTSEGRKAETPLHSIEPNTGRQPLPPGTGAFRPAAPQTAAENPKPPHSAAQPAPPRPPHLPSQPLQQPQQQPPPQPQPHPHQNLHPHPHPAGGFVHPQHAHGPFGRMPSLSGQAPAGPQHHPSHPQHSQHQQHPQHSQHSQHSQHQHAQHPPHTQHPQHSATSGPPGPGRALIGQQDIFAARPTPVQNEKEQQQQRVAMPIRSTSMQSEPEVQTPKPIGQSMSMSPTPGAVQTNSLEDVSIEINWARNLDYSDYLSMESCLHCKTAGEFFSLIEAQMPDELQGTHGNGNRVKEVRVKALTPLQGEGNTPRIKRDEASGRIALRKLIKKLRSQPADADIELEFLVVWE